MSEYIKKSVLYHWLSLYPRTDIPLEMLTYYLDRMQGVGEDAISAEYEGYKKTAEKEMELCRELTVADAEIERQAKKFAEKVIRVYGCRIDIDGQPAYSSGGSPVLEEAFAIARWDDPHWCQEEEEVPMTTLGELAKEQLMIPEKDRATISIDGDLWKIAGILGKYTLLVVAEDEKAGEE